MSKKKQGLKWNIIKYTTKIWSEIQNWDCTCPYLCVSSLFLSIFIQNRKRISCSWRFLVIGKDLGGDDEVDDLCKNYVSV